jgi:hypothetical protein
VRVRAARATGEELAALFDGQLLAAGGKKIKNIYRKATPYLREREVEECSVS